MTLLKIARDYIDFWELHSEGYSYEHFGIPRKYPCFVVLIPNISKRMLDKMCTFYYEEDLEEMLTKLKV